MYVNNLGDEGPGRVQAAYGENYPRLAAVKRTYDPDNLFRANQNIDPFGASRNVAAARRRHQSTVVSVASTEATGARDGHESPLRRGRISAGLDAGLARDLAVRWSVSVPTRCGRTTSRPLAGLQMLAHFAAAPTASSSASGSFPSTDISRSGSQPRSTVSGWIPQGSGSGSGRASCARRSTSCTGPSPSCVSSSRRETRIVVAAMRPRLCRLGGAIADGVLLNWMLPAQAAAARRWVQEGADEAGRAAPLVAAYVRVAVGPGSQQRLRDEEGHYRTINEAHRKHFEAMDVPLGSVGVAASTRSEVLQDWRRTTPRSTSRSRGCSPITMQPRWAPPRSRRRHEPHFDHVVASTARYQAGKLIRPSAPVTGPSAPRTASATASLTGVPDRDGHRPGAEERSHRLLGVRELDRKFDLIVVPYPKAGHADNFVEPPRCGEARTCRSASCPATRPAGTAQRARRTPR